MRRGLATAAAVAWASAAAAAPQACKLEKLAELPVRFEGNRALIDAQLNGKPATLMLDTGAEISVLFARAVGAYGLKPVDTHRWSLSGVGGSRRASEVTIGDLRFGQFHGRDVTLLVIGDQADKTRETGFQVAGLIGRDQLHGLDLEFDLAAKTVRLFRDQGCGATSLAYWTDVPGVMPMQSDSSRLAPFEVMVKLNGHPVRAIVDSGAPTSIVTDGAAAAAGVSPRTLSYTDHEFVGGIGAGGRAVTTATFDKVEVSDEATAHARLRVADMFRDTQSAELGTRVASVSSVWPSMLLGADFLRAHRVLIAPGQNRIYFTYNGGPIFQVVGPVAASTAAAEPTKSADVAKPKS